MSDNKSRDIFYGVVAIATLIVAILGATLPALTRVFPKLAKKPGLDFSAVVPVAMDVALVAPAIC